MRKTGRRVYDSVCADRWGRVGRRLPLALTPRLGSLFVIDEIRKVEPAHMSDLQVRFAEAQQGAQGLAERPDNDTMLKLYALYKQATRGDAAGDRPGPFDFVAGRSSMRGARLPVHQPRTRCSDTSTWWLLSAADTGSAAPCAMLSLYARPGDH